MGYFKIVTVLLVFIVLLSCKDTDERVQKIHPHIKFHYTTDIGGFLGSPINIDEGDTLILDIELVDALHDNSKDFIKDAGLFVVCIKTNRKYDISHRYKLLFCNREQYNFIKNLNTNIHYYFKCVKIEGCFWELIEIVTNP